MKFVHHIWKTALLVSILASVFVIPSCNRADDIPYKGAYLTYFGFDSFPDIKNYKFYIDNFAHTIWNEDSFPFATEVDSLYPCLTVSTSNDKIYINGEAWKQKTRVDWSDCPISLQNTSADGDHSITYQVYVNVHQQDPDSLQMKRISQDLPSYSPSWKMIDRGGEYFAFGLLEDSTLSVNRSSDGRAWADAGSASGLSGLAVPAGLCWYKDRYFLSTDNFKLYASDDLLNWQAVSDTTEVRCLFGVLEGRKYLSEDALLGIVDKGGKPYFARYESSWTLGDSVPADFPISGFAVCFGKTVTDVAFLTVMTGLNAAGELSQTTWSTMDGLYWVCLSDQLDGISPRKGASVFYYDNTLYLYGGEDAEGHCDPTLYCSSSHGLSWKSAPSKDQFKELPEGLAYQQVLADEEHIRIFGGNGSTEVWEAFINRMLFLKK